MAPLHSLNRESANKPSANLMAPILAKLPHVQLDLACSAQIVWKEAYRVKSEPFGEQLYRCCGIILGTSGMGAYVGIYRIYSRCRTICSLQLSHLTNYRWPLQDKQQRDSPNTRNNVQRRWLIDWLGRVWRLRKWMINVCIIVTICLWGSMNIDDFEFDFLIWITVLKYISM